MQKNKKLFCHEVDKIVRMKSCNWQSNWVHGADTLLATKPENVNTYEAFLNRIDQLRQKLGNAGDRLFTHHRTERLLVFLSFFPRDC